MKNLTKEERIQIAVEEMKNCKFEITSTAVMCYAGQLMKDTNADNIKTSTEITIQGKRYKVEAIYKMKEVS
jgi:ribosomal 50S subunit-associated protein YjgA (DUF615 family)